MNKLDLMNWSNDGGLNLKEEEYFYSDSNRSILEPEYREDTDKGLSLFALFVKLQDAEKAKYNLIEFQFAEEDISLLAPNKKGNLNFVYKQGSSVLLGAAIGGLLGIVLITSFGFFLGLKETNPNSYGLNPFSLQFTPLSASITIIFGLFFGIAAGALVGVGIPKSAAKRLGFYLKEGGIVLVIRLRDNGDQFAIKEILEKHRGQDICVLDNEKIWSTIIPEKSKLIEADTF